MSAFEYEALDLSGRTRRGVVSAETPRLARQELRRLELTPVAVHPSRALERSGNTSSINHRQLVEITRQLAVLLEAATPLDEALHAVAMLGDNESVRKRILAVRERVTEGARFSEALSEDRKSFPDLYCAVIAGGEASGDLAQVLDRLATMLERNRSMRNRALGSLIYPVALAIFASAVVGALMTLVVPKIVAQFEAFDTEPPVITQLVVGASNFLIDYGWAIVAVFIAGGFAFFAGLRTTAFKRQFDKWVLSVPILGGLLRGLEGARYARTLSTLFAGGAPLLNSLAGAERTLMNDHMRERLEGATAMVREGGSLTAALKRADILPPMMAHMVAAGERAGALPKMLDKAADQLEEEFENAANVALRLLEPVIIAVLGGMVLIIVVAIMLPMLQLPSLVSG